MQQFHKNTFEYKLKIVEMHPNGFCCHYYKKDLIIQCCFDIHNEAKWDQKKAVLLKINPATQ